jgi:hypothetical protein
MAKKPVPQNSAQRTFSSIDEAITFALSNGDTPAIRATNYLNVVEAGLHLDLQGGGNDEYNQDARTILEMLRNQVRDAPEQIHVLIYLAAALGQSCVGASKLKPLNPFLQLKANQVEGGRRTRKIDPAFRSQIESKATTLRNTEPKLYKAMMPLCKRIAAWLSEDKSFTYGKAVSWQTVRDFLDKSGYLDAHFERRKLSSL